MTLKSTIASETLTDGSEVHDVVFYKDNVEILRLNATDEGAAQNIQDALLNTCNIDVMDDWSPRVLPETAEAPATIDLTPTWSALMPALIMALTDGTHEGQRVARAELMRLAEHADAQNAKSKGQSNGN